MFILYTCGTLCILIFVEVIQRLGQDQVSPCMLQVDEKIKFLEFCLKHNLCNTTSFGQILGKYFAFMSRDKKIISLNLLGVRMGYGLCIHQHNTWISHLSLHRRCIFEVHILHAVCYEQNDITHTTYASFPYK